MRSMTLSLVALAAASALALPSRAADFVLQADAWGATQEAAVVAAGGKVRYAHASGLAVVSADRADFLQAVKASGAIRSGALDQVLQFKMPTRSFEISEAQMQEAAAAQPTDAFYRFIQWAPQSVKAPAAWAAGYTGRGVRVAVIDGGIFGTHPDLAANVDTAAARSFVPGPEGSCAAAWNCDTGNTWHGTHVAGIVAAPNNGLGVVGIAPDATIVPVKALHNGGGSFASVIAAILYASSEGRADIINMSLGADFNKGGPDAAELLSSMNRALNTAARNGSLVVSSAGNDSYDLDHSRNLVTVPAQSGNGLAVSSTGPLGYALGATNFSRLSSFSNYGRSAINVAAPGGDFALEGNALCTMPRSVSGTVTVPCWVFDMVISTTRGGWGWLAGTSMAAPAASAVAALIKQRYPGISVGALKNELQRATDDEGKRGADPVYGRGYINAWKAVTQ